MKAAPAHAPCVHTNKTWQQVQDLVTSNFHTSVWSKAQPDKMLLPFWLYRQHRCVVIPQVLLSYCGRGDLGAESKRWETVPEERTKVLQLQ